MVMTLGLHAVVVIRGPPRLGAYQKRGYWARENWGLARTRAARGRVLDEAGTAVDHLVALLADNFALLVLHRSAFVGRHLEFSLSRLPLLRLLAALLGLGRRALALNVSVLLVGNLAVAVAMHAADANGRGLALHAVVTGRLRNLAQHFLGHFRTPWLVGVSARVTFSISFYQKFC